MEDLLLGMESEGLENKSTAYIRMAKLNHAEKQILALLAAAGGNMVPLEVIKGIFKDQDELRTIEKLVALGLVQSHSPRFSITDTLTSSIAATWDLTAWQDLLLNHAMNWLGQKPASALVNEAGDLLMYVIKNAGERKKWREVIQLGRALEKFMISNKRWQAWADILNLVLTAARALKDRKVEAWALHQLGSRALYLGNASEARTILTQAFNIRQAIGDKAGLAVTRHNLNTLNGIVTPAKGNTSGCRKYLTCGFAAVIGLVMILAVIIWLAMSSRSLLR